MRVATFNINGIRATHRRGFGDWLASRDCDVVALQEVRAPVAALPDGAFGGYHAAYDPGTLAGRNGVAILTRMPPAAVRTWGAPAVRLDPDGQPTREAPDPDDRDGTAYPRLARELRDFAHQGRYLEVDLADAPVTIASLYLPKGGLPAHLQVAGRMREAPDGGARYERKMRFLAGFARQVTAARRQARAAGREFLLLGDLNIAHEPLDVVNWRRQVRNEGFLPEEREWFGALVGPRRLVDVVRRLHPDTQGPYSWWSWLGESFTNDTGWRIDYHLATPRLARAAVRATTDREASRDARLSDHAAVVVDYDLGRTVGRARRVTPVADDMAKSALTLTDLEGDDWGDPPVDGTYLMRTCTALRRMPLRDFEPEDLRIMIGQGISLPILVPMALTVLADDPSAAGDFGPGDLLRAVCAVPESYWAGRPEEAARLAQIREAAEAGH